MKSRIALMSVVVLYVCGGTLPSFAHEGAQDPLAPVIRDLLRTHQGSTLCIDDSLSPHKVQSAVIYSLKLKGVTGSVTVRNIASALWELFPCPFSPYRDGLRPAKASEIVGAWVFPEASQKLRFGPRSPQQPPTGALPVKCDAVGYFPEGELRHAIIAGVESCPFEKSSDLDGARKNPKVASWSLLRDGRIGVTRTDVLNHIEEWDIYIVSSPFVANDVQFSPDELIAYIRKETGNEFGAATQFRHLKRLP